MLGSYDRTMTTRAIILSGGRSKRFGGTHKPGVELGGRSVISRLLESMTTARPDIEVWIAGPPDGLDEIEASQVRTVLEKPRFGGPLAGIAAVVSEMANSRKGEYTGAETILEGQGGSVGGENSSADGQGGPPDGQSESLDVTVIIAGDMPLVSSAHIASLVDACRKHQRPASSRDDRGKLQYLCTAWPTELLASRIHDIGDPENLPVRLLFEGMEPTIIDVDPRELTDFDTQEEFDELAGRDK